MTHFDSFTVMTSQFFNYICRKDSYLSYVYKQSRWQLVEGVFHQSNPTSLDSPPVLIQQSISSLSHSSAWTQLIIYHLHTITLFPTCGTSLSIQSVDQFHLNSVPSFSSASRPIIAVIILKVFLRRRPQLIHSQVLIQL